MVGSRCQQIDIHIAREFAGSQRLDHMLQDVTFRCPSFKFGKEDLRTALKEIAEFKSPGVYELTEYVKKRELHTLQQELAIFATSAGELTWAARVPVPLFLTVWGIHSCSYRVL
jgi:hypothetical protein